METTGIGNVSLYATMADGKYQVDGFTCQHTLASWINDAKSTHVDKVQGSLASAPIANPYLDAKVFASQVSAILNSGPIVPCELKVARKKEEKGTATQLGKWNYATDDKRLEGFSIPKALVYAGRFIKRGKSADGMKPVKDDTLVGEFLSIASMLYMFGNTEGKNKTNVSCKGNEWKSLETARKIVRRQYGLPNKKRDLIIYAETENGESVRTVHGAKKRYNGKLFCKEQPGRKSNARRRGIKTTFSVRKDIYLATAIDSEWQEFPDAIRSVVSHLASGNNASETAEALGVNKMAVSRIVRIVREIVGTVETHANATVHYVGEPIPASRPEWKPNVRTVVLTSPPPSSPMERNLTTDTSKPNCDHSAAFAHYLETIRAIADSSER